MTKEQNAPIFEIFALVKSKLSVKGTGVLAKKMVQEFIKQTLHKELDGAKT